MAVDTSDKQLHLSFYLLKTLENYHDPVPTVIKFCGISGPEPAAS